MGRRVWGGWWWWWCGVVWCGVGVWRRRRGRRLRTLSRPRYVSNDDIYTQQASETRESVFRESEFRFSRVAEFESDASDSDN